MWGEHSVEACRRVAVGRPRPDKAGVSDLWAGSVLEPLNLAGDFRTRESIVARLCLLLDARHGVAVEDGALLRLVLIASALIDDLREMLDQVLRVVHDQLLELAGT